MLTRAAGVAQGFSPAGAAMARTRVACTLRMLSLAALTLASPSVQHASAPPQSTVADARSLVDAGKLDEAEQLLRRHLVTEPHSPDGHLLLGYVLFRKIQEDARYLGGSGHSEATREAAKSSLAAYAEGSRYRDLSAFDLKIAALDQSLVGDLISADRS